MMEIALDERLVDVGRKVHADAALGPHLTIPKWPPYDGNWPLAVAIDREAEAR